MKFSLKSKTVNAEYSIEGHTGYFLSDENKMYNIATRREIRLVMYGYTKGYYLNRKFYSLTRLQTMVQKINI